ncbi:MAG: TonB-dependent receptor [Thiobacillus sp.]
MKRLSRALCAGGLTLSGFACAQTPTVAELPVIVVTPPSEDGSAFTVPHSVSVIGRADIDRAGTASLTGVLSREAGVNLRSFTGNDKFAGIDLRGMGDTSVSNVLVLLDGVRLNEIDLSGADLSSVPLSAIQRIEIVRGGGAVRWGDGAVGGVVNIVTRAPRAGVAQGSLGVSAASYGGRAAFADVAGGAGDWRVRAAMSAARTDGYRQNSELDRTDGSFDLRYLPAAMPLELFGRVAVHKDRYGLPGPVSATAFTSGEAARRASNAPFDGGETADRRLTLGASLDLEARGRLEWQTSWRDRENPYLIGYNPLASMASQMSRIESDTADTLLRYSLAFDAWGHTHDLGVGAHRQTADYTRSENGVNVVDSSSRRIGDLTGEGIYTEATLRGPHGVALNLGARANRTQAAIRDERYTQQCYFIFIGGIPIPINCVNAYRVQSHRSNTWRDRAFELGATWKPDAARVLFASASRHFRTPNIDELAFATDTLRPQRGLTLETGVRIANGHGNEFSATVFGMRVEDEIHFGQDPVSGLSLNRNYDLPTCRLGAELQARWRVAPDVSLTGNAAYVQPRFEGADTDIPHVPRRTASFGAEWKAGPGLRLSINARYVGARYDGNDTTNQLYPKLPAYRVVDLGARYAVGEFELHFGVNNLFDEVYSTVGYSATYYPMPGRNYQAGLSWRF